MALTDNLVAYWRLDEASGTRADQIGGFTLTDNNTVGSATGNISALAGDFIKANTETLSTTAAGVTGVPVSGASWTITGWMRPESPIETEFGEVFGTHNFRGFMPRRRGLTAFGTSQVNWNVINDAGTTFQIEPVANTPINSWHYISLTFNHSTGQMRARTNATYSSNVAFSGAITASAGFRIGCRWQIFATTLFDGQIGHVGLWARALSDAEQDQLYNSGAGLDPTASTGSALPLFAAQMMAMR